MIKPNFFIVGAPKCGTTAMNDYLAQHPGIFMAKKELHFFGADLRVRSRPTEQKYLENFRGAAGKKIIGEASVWYLFSQTAAREIRDFSPGARILIMLRNPVDVIYSLHSQHLFDGNEDVTDFEAALNLDEQRKNGTCLPDSVDYIKLPSYKDSALFSKQVKRYLDVFDRDRVHIVLYDDFMNDTSKTVEGTLKFLGVPGRPAAGYDVVNQNKQIKWFFLHRIIKKPPFALKKIARILVPSRNFRHFIMSHVFKWNIKMARRKKMGTELRNQLKKLFADDIHVLSGVIDRDLSAWT